MGRLDPHIAEGDLVAGAIESLNKLSGAKLPPELEIEFETHAAGRIAIHVRQSGDPLDELANALFRPALEATLARYLDWLDRIAKGEPFPSAQLLP